MKTKVCTKCKIRKPLYKFAKRTDIKSGFSSQCQKCVSKRSINYYYKNHKRCNRKNWESQIKRNFNITPEEWQQMYDEQLGCCAICGIHQSELKKRLDTDHNHITKQVRMLLCNSCNSGLGKFKVDSMGIKLLEKAIEYIKETGYAR